MVKIHFLPFNISISYSKRAKTTAYNAVDEAFLIGPAGGGKQGGTKIPRVKPVDFYLYKSSNLSGSFRAVSGDN